MTLASKIAKFEKEWKAHTFSTGVYPGEDYVSFQRKYRNLLKAVAENAGMELHSFNKNHYEFSAVLRDKETGAFVYVSISDVRFFPNEWATSILYRTMAHEKDWTGGYNRYSTLSDLSDNLRRLYA